MNTCTFCHKSGATKVCSGCKHVCYCNSECQKAHWNVHRTGCWPRSDTAAAVAASDSDIEDGVAPKPGNYVVVIEPSGSCYAHEFPRSVTRDDVIGVARAGSVASNPMLGSDFFVGCDRTLGAVVAVPEGPCADISTEILEPETVAGRNVAGTRFLSAICAKRVHRVDRRGREVDGSQTELWGTQVGRVVVYAIGANSWDSVGMSASSADAVAKFTEFISGDVPDSSTADKVAEKIGAMIPTAYSMNNGTERTNVRAIATSMAIHMTSDPGNIIVTVLTESYEAYVPEIAFMLKIHGFGSKIYRAEDLTSDAMWDKAISDANAIVTTINAFSNGKLSQLVSDGSPRHVSVVVMNLGLLAKDLKREKEYQGKRDGRTKW